MEMIQSYRVKAERAEKLKDKSFELSMALREHIREPDLIGYLIDMCTDSIKTHDGGFLTLDITKLEAKLKEEAYNHTVK